MSGLDPIDAKPMFRSEPQTRVNYLATMARAPFALHFAACPDNPSAQPSKRGAMTKPFLTQTLTIEPGWIDYNDHLNMGYYTVLFDRAADEAFEGFGFGQDYISRTNHTTFSGEFHLRYLREVKLGDRLRSTFYLIDYDEKRFHTFQELYHEDGWISATGEGLTLHVNLDGPKVTPMPDDIMARIKSMADTHAAQPRPDGISRRVGIPRKG